MGNKKDTIISVLWGWEMLYFLILDLIHQITNDYVGYSYSKALLVILVTS